MRLVWLFPGQPILVCFEYLNLFVDGVHVADLGLGQGYDALLPPGPHVLSVSTTPQVYQRTPPTQRLVTAEPGETYAFTAFWKNSYRPYLERNGTSKRIITPSNPRLDACVHGFLRNQTELDVSSDERSNHQSRFLSGGMLSAQIAIRWTSRASVTLFTSAKANRAQSVNLVIAAPRCVWLS